jgi:hypothetical protein
VHGGLEVLHATAHGRLGGGGAMPAQQEHECGACSANDETIVQGEQRSERPSHNGPSIGTGPPPERSLTSSTSARGRQITAVTSNRSASLGLAERIGPGCGGIVNHMLAQIRIYTINRGEMDTFLAHFTTQTVGLHEQVGIPIVGMWINRPQNEFIWVRTFADAEDRDARSMEFQEAARAAGVQLGVNVAKMEIRETEPVSAGVAGARP